MEDSFEKWLEAVKPNLRSMYEEAIKEEGNKEENPEETKRPVWEYEKIGETHIVAIEPLALRMFVGSHQGTNLPMDNFMNASFVWWEDYPNNQKPYPTSMIIYNGEIISNKQPNGYWSGQFAGQGVPTPTFIVYKDGRVIMKDVNDLSSEAESIHIAVTVVQTNPLIRQQGYSPYVSWSSIDYSANRIGIFYRIEDKRVLLVYRPTTNTSRLHTTGVNIGADFGGSLDSGGSANFRVNGVRVNVTSRRMYAALVWG